MTITEKLLTVNSYSRPGTKRSKTTKIAVHYVGNSNTSALANRNYFENLKSQTAEAEEKKTAKYVSAHYVVGLDGEVIRCVPDDEIAYTTNSANAYSIGVETCHPKADGVFSDATYISLCELCAVLLKKYSLTVNDLIRHYDVTGKQCPLHWSPTKYQSEALATARWNRFKQDVRVIMDGGKVTKNNTVDITVTSTATPTLPYKVKIVDTELNVRKGAGTVYSVVCTVKKGEVYTITEEKVVGTSIWGKLKSGAGWINVGSKYVTKV